VLGEQRQHGVGPVAGAHQHRVVTQHNPGLQQVQRDRGGQHSGQSAAGHPEFGQGARPVAAGEDQPAGAQIADAGRAGDEQPSAVPTKRGRADLEVDAGRGALFHQGPYLGVFEPEHSPGRRQAFHQRYRVPPGQVCGGGQPAADHDRSLSLRCQRPPSMFALICFSLAIPDLATLPHRRGGRRR
jgi:hypothetical protein